MTLSGPGHLIYDVVLRLGFDKPERVAGKDRESARDRGGGGAAARDNATGSVGCGVERLTHFCCGQVVVHGTSMRLSARPL
jgi:hypothetical protein